MDRRTALKTIAMGVAAPTILRGRYPLSAQSPTEYSARAIRLVTESPVVDMLCQFRFDDLREGGERLLEAWLRDPSSFTDEHARLYLDSGVDVLALGRGESTRSEAIEFMAYWNGFIASHGEVFMRVDEPRDFDRARELGKIGIIITSQQGSHFESLDDVELFHHLGMRSSQLTYNFQNDYAAGFLENRDGGLTVAGAELVERMEEVGMAVDLGHAGDRTMLDVLDMATRPPIISHGACRALVPGATRLATDEAIGKLAEAGGVIGIAFLRFMIRSGPPVGVDDVVDHFEHVVRNFGVEHVGVGSDLDLYGYGSARGPGDLPRPASQANFERYQAFFTDEGYVHIDGLNHPKRIFDLTEGFIRRGFSDAEISLMLGGNWRRVLSELWA